MNSRPLASDNIYKNLNPKNPLQINLNFIGSYFQIFCFWIIQQNASSDEEDNPKLIQFDEIHKLHT